MRTMYYDQNTEAIEDTLTWAKLFENSKDRIIGQTVTLYGEKLSTVWLGIDHQWGEGLPLIFETMLFAPDRKNVMRRFVSSMARGLAEGNETGDDELKAEADAHSDFVRKYFPHDQLQVRYTWKADARESFEKIRLQCLIPPRWRRFIWYTIFKDETWN